MKAFSSFFVVMAVSALLFTQSDAATRYSKSNGNWNSTNTWSATPTGTVSASVPVAGDEVVINRKHTVTVNVSNAACASVQIGSTTNATYGVLSFKASSRLTVSGAVVLGGSAISDDQYGVIDMTEGGTLSCASITSISPANDDWTPGKGTVELTAANTLPSQTFLSFYNLIVRGETTLGACITITGTLTLAQGSLNTAAVRMLTLGPDASVSGGSSASFVNGPMRFTWKTATASKTFPVGKTSYEPLTISLTNPSNPVLQAECFDAAPSGTPALPLTRLSSSHYYRASLITGTAAKGGSVTIPNHSDIAANPTNLVVAQSVDPASTFTRLTGNYGSDALVTSSGYNPALAAVLALGTTEPPLPVELTSFTASVRKGVILLSWATATEVNNAGFEVERRSASSSDWQKLGFVEGHGSSNVQHAYAYSDAAVQSGSYTYRLKQIDRDGAYEYSQEVEAAVALTAEDYMISQNYPNPFNPTTNIRFAVPATQNVELKVFNMLGQEVATLFNGPAEAGVVQTVQFNATGLASGTYIYRLHTADRTEVKRMLLVR